VNERSSKRIRTGIIGYGLSGRIFHSPFVATNDRFSLDVIATSDPSRQAEARAHHPGAEIVATPAELIERGLDLVVLASPAHAHLEQGLAALASGAAVVIDKPFAASVSQAEQLIAAGGNLFVYQNRRWDGDFLTVRKLVGSGALGTVHRFESTFERWSPALRDRWQDTTPISQGAGITFDLGSHVVDQALQLFGPATLVDAELSVLREGGVSDDDAFLSLRHDSGVHSHLTVSRFAGQSGPRFRVLGSESAYASYGLDGQEPALMAGASPADPGFGEQPESAWGTLGTGADLVPVPMERGDYAAFYAGVAATLLDGAASPVDARDSLAVLSILEQAHSF
jgi:scyllo-inositol 2-dehydrogenase (NADP+)